MKNIRLKNIKAFTLIEMTLVALILGILLPSIFSMYNFIIRSNKEINARQVAIQWWYEFFERLNILMQDYSVDYEEYFNRQMVWCSDNWWILTWNDFKWNVWLSWYCSEFTAYWNNNSIGRVSSTGRDLYYCTTRNIGQDFFNVSRVVTRNNCGRYGRQQSFGQYAALFTDVKWTEDWLNWDIVWTSDDEELWRIVNERDDVKAIEDSDHIQEIYLISHDGKDRLYFRRKLIHQEGEQLQYKIQMLRLKGFDAWQKHSFDVVSNNVWLYDWVIDTWACDASMWFNWRWVSVGGAFSDFHLPADVEDCWVDINQWVTTVRLRNISISPLNDSDLFRADADHQINPSMKILIVNWIYSAIYGTGYFSSSINDFSVPLETTINMKDFYKE